MPKSIKVVGTKSGKEDQWPLFFKEEIKKNLKILQDIGVQEYILSDGNNWNLDEWDQASNVFDNRLLLSYQYYFPTDELFSRYKDIAYNYIPVYKTAFSDNELLEYYALNHINVTFEEIDNPDLTGYVLLPYSGRL
jgi:hypothetical protein